MKVQEFINSKRQETCKICVYSTARQFTRATKLIDNKLCYVNLITKSFALNINKELSKEIVETHTETTEAIDPIALTTYSINVYYLRVKRLSKNNKGKPKLERYEYNEVKGKFVL